MTNPKTTLIGIIMLLSICWAFLLVWHDKATLTEVGSYSTAVIGILTSIGFIMTKDHDKK